MATPTPPPAVAPTFVPPPPPPALRMPYYPSLPWLSVPEAPFPARASQRRRRRGPVASSEEGLAFPSREEATPEEPVDKEDESVAEQTPAEEIDDSHASTAPLVSDLETPATSQAPSEVDSTHPTTPSSALPVASRQPPPAHARKATVPAVPLIPIKPAVPASATSVTPKSTVGEKEEVKAPVESPDAAPHNSTDSENPPAAPPAPKAAPKSWAELLRSKAAPAAAKALPSNGVVPVNGTPLPKGNSLADVLSSFSVDNEKRVAFLKPRGLVNPGNLCYMNSVSPISILL